MLSLCSPLPPHLSWHVSSLSLQLSQKFFFKKNLKSTNPTKFQTLKSHLGHQPQDRSSSPPQPCQRPLLFLSPYLITDGFFFWANSVLLQDRPGYAPICLRLEDFYIRWLYLRIQVGTSFLSSWRLIICYLFRLLTKKLY